MTWYVVFRGRKPGVYRDWQTCNQQVCGFSNCLFRGYQKQEEAVADYISFFATGEMTAAPNQQPPQIIAAAAPVRDVQAALGAAPYLGPVHTPGAGYRLEREHGPAAAGTDMLPVVIILVAIIMALIGYILN